MLYSYNDCTRKYGNLALFNKALSNSKIYKIEKGIYSDKKNVSELEVIAFKNKDAVFASDSAYFYHDLTDYVPEKYFLATDKDDYKIRDKRVKQIFYLHKQYLTGIEEMNYNGVSIKIYDKERMLVELIRKKNIMPFDYYKELIKNYRDISSTLDVSKIQSYIKLYKNNNNIYSNLMLEVF